MTKLNSILLASALACAAVAPAQNVQGLTGKPISFALKDIDGHSLSSKALKGRVVLLDFWATWCGPCKAASPTLDRLYKQYRGRGLTVIGVNLSNNPAAVRQYVKTHGYSYPFTAGTQGSDAFAKSLGVSQLPVFILVNRNGHIASVQQSFTLAKTPAEIEGKVKALLR